MFSQFFYNPVPPKPKNYKLMFFPLFGCRLTCTCSHQQFVGKGKSKSQGKGKSKSSHKDKKPYKWAAPTANEKSEAAKTHRKPQRTIKIGKEGVETLHEFLFDSQRWVPIANISCAATGSTTELSSLTNPASPGSANALARLFVGQQDSLSDREYLRRVANVELAMTKTRQMW